MLVVTHVFQKIRTFGDVWCIPGGQKPDPLQKHRRSPARLVTLQQPPMKRMDMSLTIAGTQNGGTNRTAEWHMFGIFPYTGLTLNRTYSSDLQFTYLKCPLNMTTSKWDRMGIMYACVWRCLAMGVPVYHDMRVPPNYGYEKP